jgi:two-component system, OmpR family, sensor kinase
MPLSLDTFDDDRLLEGLEQLLTIQTPRPRPALDQASTLVRTALRADQVDVFLYEAATDSLVALGTSATPMSQRQHHLGLNRQPLAHGGAAVRVFQTGEPYLTGHADEASDQLREVSHGLGVRSALDVPFEVNRERCGVLQADASEPDRFSVTAGCKVTQ